MKESKKKRFIGITLDDSELEDADAKLEAEIKKEMEELGLTNEAEYVIYLDNKIKNENPQLYQIMKEYFENSTN